MILKAKYTFMALLGLSACTNSAAPPANSHNNSTLSVVPVRDTVEFGSTPLWREMDSAISLRLKSLDSISGASVSDSDWVISNDFPIAVQKDSTANILLQYIPRTLSSHQGNIALFSGTDTVAIIYLLGQTSSFERHIGDSYIFRTNSGEVDSVVVSALPIRFTCSLDTHIARELETIFQDSNDDWIAANIGYAMADTRLPVATGSSFKESRSGFDSSVLGEYSINSLASIAGDTVVNVGGVSLSAKLVNASASLTSYLRTDYRSNGGTFHAAFVDSIGMFSSIQDWYWFSRDPNSQGTINYESHQLIRFHLRR